MENNTQPINIQDDYSLSEEESVDKIVIILKKSGIEEDIEEAFQKIDQGKLSLIVETGKAIDNVNDGKILEKDLLILLQKNLSIPETTAQKILDNIKTEKLINIAVKKPVSEITSSNIKKSGEESNQSSEADKYRESV